MLKLIKWTLIGTVAVGATSFFLFGDHAWNYVSTAIGSVKEGVRGRIPVEFEIKRAEKLIRAIGPEIQHCKLDLARAEVQLDNLMDDVARLERRIAVNERKLQRAASLAGEGTTVPARLASTDSIRHERMQVELERLFETYKADKALLRSKKSLVQRHSQAVAAARARLDAVRNERARLVDLVGTLKAQKNQIDAMAASSRSFTLDDSALSKAKEVLQQVKERLDVAQRMLEDDLAFERGDRTSDAPHRDVLVEIRKYFRSQQEGGPTKLPTEQVEDASATVVVR